MNTLRKVAVIIGVLVLGGNYAFHHVLSDEQRADVRAANEEVRSAFQEVADVVSPLVSKGPTSSERRAAVEANQERTQSQWEAIGY